MSSAAAEEAALPEMTIEQWADMDEDEPGELLDGQLVEEEEPDFEHEAIVAWLVAMCFGWVLPRGGFAVASGVKFAVAPKHGRKADVSVYLPGGAVPPRHGVVRVPPDIMVEVISRRPRDVRCDRIEKFVEYAAFGVRYYWLIQPNARTVEIYELQPAGRYLWILGASSGAIDVPGCPELRLDLDALWAYVARLAKPKAASTVTRLRKVKKTAPRR
jgi:Uma2 family endonuclease